MPSRPDDMHHSQAYNTNNITLREFSTTFYISRSHVDGIHPLVGISKQTRALGNGPNANGANMERLLIRMSHAKCRRKLPVPT